MIKPIHFGIVLNKSIYQLFVSNFPLISKNINGLI